ncbi:MAG: hypothetical protein U5S82_04205 [Gammaproteobacteria bacterium]|nr:hypothetical protein [Gammaproteobacteria bacterium]
MPLLLAIMELGGYPNLMDVYRQAGYEVVTANSMRKAIALMKKRQPAVIVAEFNYQSDFRDRTSSLESLLATRQTRCPAARVVVFYETEQAGHLDKVLGRFPVDRTLAFPIVPAAVAAALEGLAAD